MLDIFSGLRLVIKRRSINIDNAIFRCHWFFTSTLLVAFSFIITARQYVGQPIECHSIDKLPDSLLNSYCWVQSTFSVPQACNNQLVGADVPYPCIDNTRGRDIKMYAYYQWVGIVLFVQGLLFHLPYYLWKLWENGLIKAITVGLRVAVLNEQERAKKKEIVVEYIHDHLGCHKPYAFKYFLCEFICLVNLVGQLWATNKFFSGQFLRYGLDVMEYSSSSIAKSFASGGGAGGGGGGGGGQQSPTSNDTLGGGDLSTLGKKSESRSYYQLLKRQQQQQQQQQVDPMTFVFPRMTKCTYYDFGSSGDVQKHDALCLLPLNIINEKIYIVLWFWFLILALLTLLVIIYRLLAIMSESVRCKGLISRCKLSCERDIRIICKHCDVGDWFLFYMVAENLDPLIMREIVASIAKKIQEHLDLKSELRYLQQQQHQHDDQTTLTMLDEIEKEKLKQIMEEEQQLHRRRRQLIRQQSSLVVGDTYTSGEAQDNSLSVGETTTAAATTSQQQVPLIKKIKKRLYNKRLWSIDLGASELRQQLFGAQQSAAAPPASPTTPTGTGSHRLHLASAPPASEMALNSAAPRRMSTTDLPAVVGRGASRRCESLTRKISSSSTSGISTASAASTDSFIMEMATISGSTSRLNDELAGAASRRDSSSCAGRGRDGARDRQHYHVC